MGLGVGLRGSSNDPELPACKNCSSPTLDLFDDSYIIWPYTIPTTPYIEAGWQAYDNNSFQKISSNVIRSAEGTSISAAGVIPGVQNSANNYVDASKQG